MPQLKLFFAIGISLLILYAGFRYYKNPHALRDDCTVYGAKPYSFSRVQLWWWTLVIIISFTMVYGLTGQFWAMNETCLALLGISLFTTTSGRIIDNQQIADPNVTRHQDAQASQGLFPDILSDDYGLSVHRFQVVAFNLVYSGYFLIETFSKVSDPACPLADTGTCFPSFDAQTLALLGVSSSAYLALKMTEGKGNPPTESQPDS